MNSKVRTNRWGLNASSAYYVGTNEIGWNDDRRKPLAFGNVHGHLQWRALVRMVNISAWNRRSDELLGGGKKRSHAQGPHIRRHGAEQVVRVDFSATRSENTRIPGRKGDKFDILLLVYTLSWNSVSVSKLTISKYFKESKTILCHSPFKTSRPYCPS